MPFFYYYFYEILNDLFDRLDNETEEDCETSCVEDDEDIPEYEDLLDIIDDLQQVIQSLKQERTEANLPHIQDVIFNPPATIIKWDDGTKTVVKCGKDDIYDKEKGLAMALLKKLHGNNGGYNEIFKKWCW